MPYTSHQEKARETYRTRVVRGMQAAMEDLEEFAVAITSTGWPPPSSPGQPPHLRTGTLRGSIGHEVRVQTAAVVGRLGVRRGPADKYAKHLEIGTERMAARPYLRPTVLLNRREILRHIQQGR
jgi:hypothetical protein